MTILGKIIFTYLSKAFYHYDPFVHIDHCDFFPMCPYWIFTKTSRPLDSLVKFLYTGKLNEDGASSIQELFPLMYAAQKYIVRGLQDAIEERLIYKRLNIGDNICPNLDLAEFHCLERTKDHLVSFLSLRGEESDVDSVSGWSEVASTDFIQRVMPARERVVGEAGEEKAQEERGRRGNPLDVIAITITRSISKAIIESLCSGHIHV